ENQAILLASLVGQEKYSGAADDLWKLYNLFSDPLVKAEALMSLGKIQAVQYLPQVIKVLENLTNNAPGRDHLSGERVAFGAIIALEKYGNMDGYLPVYFASKGWYNDRVKNQALKSLPLISEDPTERMISVIKSPGYTYDVKLAALQSVDAASVSADSKSQAALAAFNESWLASTNDVRLRGFLNSMRKTSMRMIRENGCSDSAVYPLLEKSYNQFATHAGGDRDEALDAIVTLRTLATDDAVQMLSKFLMNINGRLQSKTLTRNDEDLVREIIPAIGATKLAGGRTALNTVNALDWPSAVKALANDALSQLP
ncbi:MAG: hypothetical protein FWF29_10105, partial [Treponema sp.]|nr:hypothetical protein [Treponema sp.]